MTRNEYLVAIFCLVAGCSNAAEQKKTTSYDLAAEPAPAPSSRDADGVSNIGYSYAIGYRLDAAEIAPVQARQAALCRALRSRCLLLESSTSASGLGDGSARTALVVDARIATMFAGRLDALVSDAGGSVGERRTTAEDVTKQVIDTDARVRAKEALAARLLGLVRTGNGRVGDLVEAEKAYAQTQEDLAAARSLQAALRQRVAMSRFDLDYAARETTGALAPLRRALASAGETVGWSLGALVTFALAAFPWILALAALGWVGRRAGWRGPLAWWRARRAARRGG